MLLNELMPVYDVVERHNTTVGATPGAVYAAITSFDLSDSVIVRALLFTRAIPAMVAAVFRSPRCILAEPRARRAELRFADLERAGFRVIAEDPPTELVIGALGKFWTLGGALRADVTAAHFAAEPPPGYALAGWNFTVEPLQNGTSRLETETRVRCAKDVRVKFRIYWIVIRPGSGLIRRALLRTIRLRSEKLREASSRSDA